MPNSYTPRVIDGLIVDRLAATGAVLIEGPKACGKTFTAEQHAKSAIYLDSDPGARNALRVDPSLVLDGEPPQLIDEWQLEATPVWSHVRREVDKRKLPGQFILTGSAVPNEDHSRHSGAGRFARLTMRTMSLFESGDSTGAMSLAALMNGERPTSPATRLSVADVAELVTRGGWPLNIGKSSDVAARANIDYLKTVTDVDIARLAGARRDPATAMRLTQALARRTAMELKVAPLAQETDSTEDNIARSTVYEYLSIFEQLMVIESQPSWVTHLRSRARLRKAPRIHFADPSLAAAALRAGPKRLLSDLNFLGLLFESLVVRDARIYADTLDASIYHYRDSNDLEVDIIVEATDGRWGAFEVKLGVGEIDEASEKLLRFAEIVDTEKTGPPAILGVITATGYGYTRPDGIVVAPIGALGP
jgi:predicted AAA+ superfamily ATPase